jgi:hypothetical protein
MIGGKKTVSPRWMITAEMVAVFGRGRGGTVGCNERRSLFGEGIFGDSPLCG